jgi:putative spermidine/putrescine transport system substrate-binding protein
MRAGALKAMGVVLLMAASASVAQARDLTVTSFGGALQDAIRAAFIKPFEASTGTKIVEDTYDGALSKISAQINTGALKWDVVDVESNELIQGCQEGYFERLDWSKIGDKSKMIPAASNTSPCGVGYLTGALVLTYDKSKVAAGPQSWADFWDVKKFPGKRGMRFGPKWTLEVALMADGVKPSDVYKVLSSPGGVDRAFAKLDQIKSNIVWWKLGAESIQQLASGEVAMTAAYNGRVVATNRAEKRQFDIVWNAGSIYFMDYFVVLKGSPNKDSAEKFISLAVSANAQREMPNYVGYGPTNLAAFDGMKPTIAAELPTEERLKQSTFRDDKFWLDHNDELTQRFNVWAAK